MSEPELIRVIQRTVKPRGKVRLGIGDDAAILPDGTIITTDAYAEGVHFDLSYMTLKQAGERCACAALSDVVAMGARPEAVLVALMLPRQVARGSEKSGGRRRAAGVERFVCELYRGIESVCAELGCEVAGGDVIVADQLALTLTVTGKTRAPRLRSGARPDEWLYVTGHLGSAEAGRLLLRRQSRGVKSQPADHRTQDLTRGGSSPRALIRRHLRPIPRLEVMSALGSRIRGLIDTSDGLATDARHLSEMSEVRIVLNPEALPIQRGVRRLCAECGLDPVEFVLRSGEDYELLFTSPHRLSDRVRGVRVTRIGRVTKGSGVWIESDGQLRPTTLTGYDHLSEEKEAECGQDVDNRVNNLPGHQHCPRKRRKTASQTLPDIKG